MKNFACVSQLNANGALSVCPGSAPVGANVVIFGQGCNNPGQPVMAVFLGPKSYIGSGGGGDEFMIPVNAKNAFSVAYRIPSTYTEGGNSNPQLPVAPGPDYNIGVYPAGICEVHFTVTPP